MPIAVYREDGLASSTAMKGPCRVATTGNIALSGLQTIDGVALVADDRVLVRAQTSSIENGIYIADTGTWRRSKDFEGNRDVRKGTRIVVTDGSTYARTDWSVGSSNPIVIDESAVTFVEGEANAAADAAEADRIAAEAARAAAETAEANAEAALAAIQAIQNNGVGKVDAFAVKAAPSGWLACDGAAVSRTTYAALFAALVTDAAFTSQTFTVTIASPAVFTKADHGFTGGERERLSTTGNLPTGLNTTTDYFVKYVDANTFQLSSTFGGASINTTGSQSGTHSYLQSLWGLGNGTTTFNLPLINDDDRLPAPAGTGRQVGTNRAESVGPHNHAATFTGEPLDPHQHTYPTRDDAGEPGGNTVSVNNGANSNNLASSNVSAGTPEGTIVVDNNAGTVNLPPTVALLYCIYAGP